MAAAAPKGLLEAPSLTDAIGEDPFRCRGIAQAIRILRQEQQAIHVQWELRPGDEDLPRSSWKLMDPPCQWA